MAAKWTQLGGSASTDHFASTQLYTCLHLLPHQCTCVLFVSLALPHLLVSPFRLRYVSCALLRFAASFVACVVSPLCFVVVLSWLAVCLNIALRVFPTCSFVSFPGDRRVFFSSLRHVFPVFFCILCGSRVCLLSVVGPILLSSSVVSSCVFCFCVLFHLIFHNSCRCFLSLILFQPRYLQLLSDWMDAQRRRSNLLKVSIRARDVTSETRCIDSCSLHSYFSLFPAVSHPCLS